MELQRMHQGFLPAESATLQTVMDQRCSIEACRCLHLPQPPYTHTPGPSLADKWDATYGRQHQAPNGPQPKAILHLTQARLQLAVNRPQAWRPARRVCASARTHVCVRACVRVCVCVCVCVCYRGWEWVIFPLNHCTTIYWCLHNKLWCHS